MKKTINIIYFFITCFIIALGIFLRASLYKLGTPLWIDETALALSVLKHNILFSFGQLEVAQKCPPILMFFTYINKYIFGSNVYILRLIPFLSGILSVIAFFIMSKKMFKNKFPQIVALLIFSLCAPLIYYSQEFKQYSTDVLVCILLIISYKYIDIAKANPKNIFLYSVLTLIIPLISFPALFIIPALWFIKLTEYKGYAKKFIPIIFGYIITGLYLILLYGQLRKTEIQIELWQNGFLDFSFNKIALIAHNFFEYIDFNTIIGSVFLLAGIVIILFQRERQWLYILLIAIFSAIASYFKIYPLYERALLYIIPVAILLIIKPIDFLLSNKHISQSIVKITLSVMLTAILLYPYKTFYKTTDLYSYSYNKKFELRTEEKQIYKDFLEKYNPDENILTFIAIFDLDYYGIINKYQYNFYEKFISLKSPTENISEDINSYNSELSDYYWVILDKLLISYKKDLENYLNENNIKYELFAESKELCIYYIQKQ